MSSAEQKEQRQWPTFVGLTSDQARQKILLDYPKANIQILEEDKWNKNKGLKEDFKSDRVRIVIDKSGKVLHVPKMG